jgi:hypothetical protein
MLTHPNGKVERPNRTLLEEFAYERLYETNAARLDALQPPGGRLLQ